ncbi:MAG: glycosyltransferase, partial [Planctomycetales bacterium]
HDLLTLWAGAQAARRTGAHLVYDAHEMEWDCNRIQRKWLLRIVWRIHEAALVRLADLHVTVSPRIAELYRRRYRIAQPIVLPNAPCRSWAGEGHSAPSLYEQIPHIGDKTVLMFVGSVTRDRGIHTMLEALALLPEEFVLVALGRVVPAVHDELHAYSTRLGVRHRFFELPPVEYRAVPDVVGEADIGLIPVQPAGTSYRYCMPNKLFELMHAGLPIVTGKLPDVAAVVTSNGLGVVCDQESPEDLARAIRHVAERRETFAPGPERIEQIRDAYCWEAYAGELVMAYAALDRRAPRVGGRRSLLSGYLRPRNWMMAWWSGPDADAADLPVGLPPGSLLPARRRPSNRPSRELVAQGRD